MKNTELENKLLILGGSSYIGRHLIKQLLPGKYTATYATHPFDGGHEFDCTSDRLSDKFNELENYRYAILLLGDTEPDSCVLHPQRSNSINVDGITRVIDDLVEIGVGIIFVSTEFVFDGKQGQYSESDLASPILLYGTQKRIIERYLEKYAKDFAVLRLAKVYGGECGDGTLFTNWLSRIELGTLDKCASDQRFSPIHVDDVVDALLKTVKSRLQGVFHVGGPEGHSRMECLMTLLEEVGRFKHVDLTPKPCLINDFEFPEVRPVDVSMKIDKFKSQVRFRPRGIKEFCGELALANFGISAPKRAGY